MSDSTRTRAARSLADICAQIRAAYPDVPWQTPAREVAEAARYPLTARRAEILAHYQAGLRLREIAVLLDTSAGSICGEIARMRKLGLWPAELTRYKRPKEPAAAERAA